jgi:integrase
MRKVISFNDYLLRYNSADPIDKVDIQAPTTFPWLISQYVENTWEVRDPFSANNPKIIKVHFDGPMISGGNLSEHPTFICDAKAMLAFAIETKSLSSVKSIKSLGKITGFVNGYKRIFNELLCLNFDGWNTWDDKKNKLLFNKLSLKASVSQGYLKRLRNYENEIGIENLPIKNVNKESVNKFDLLKVCESLSINHYEIKFDKEIKDYLHELSLRLSNIYPNKKISITETIEKNRDRGKVHKKQYSELLIIIEISASISSLAPSLFIDPWPSDIMTDKIELIDNANFDTSRSKRTRNIPVNLFLEIMDAASRYVLDYAEPLFEAEVVLKNKLLEIEKEGTSSTGKIINGYAREMGLLAGGRHTPFPLSGYKNSPKGEKIISKNEYEELEELLASGHSSKIIRDLLGLTKSQYDNRKQTLGDPFKRNLPHTGLTLRKALYNFLPLSCLLIIFSFSGRRESEVFGLTTHSYKKKDNCWKVKFFVAKSDRDNSWFVHSSLVGKALMILERLSEHGRNISGSDSLFRFNDSYERAPINFDRLGRSINSFQDFIGSEKDEDGNNFKFSEHQFRRFFAIMYYYRYDKGGDSEALMYELRHADWSRSVRYLTEKKYGAILKNEEQLYIENKLSMSIDEDNIYGPIADEFKNKLKASIHIVPEKRKELAISQMTTGQLTIEIISEGLCFGNSPGRKSTSNCYEGGWVLIHNASNNTCAGCPNLLNIDEIKQNYGGSTLESAEVEGSIILDAILGVKS